MDKFGSENIRIVLLTLVLLTLATFGVLLYLVVDGQDVPTLLVGTSTTLLGLLTGTAVNLGAPARVDAPQRAASDMAFEVRSAAEIPTVTGAPASVVSTVVSYGEDDELGGDGPASGANDHPEP